MKRFIEGECRAQSTLLPERLDDWIAEDNPVRAVDASSTSWTCEAGFEGANRQQPSSYHPRLLKIYIYGYLNRVQSSRRLERECQRNVELMWLTGRLAPDFKTIADFRRDNGRGIRQACSQFVAICRKLKLLVDGVVAVDGSKFKAVNNRDKNFTRHKLKARQQQLGQSIARYLSGSIERRDPRWCRRLSSTSRRRSPRCVSRGRKLRRRAAAAVAPDQQVSLTDPDARSMATSGRGTGMVGYNVQASVDTEHHLIVAHEVISEGHDRSQLAPMAQLTQETLQTDDLRVLADRGYFSGEEIMKCEQAGVTPLVPKPLTNNAATTGRFDKRDFHYDAQRDRYTCPAGEHAIWRFTSIQKGMEIRKYWSSACPKCAIRSDCTTSDYRRLMRWEHEAVIERMQRRLDRMPEAGRLRRQTVEHTFGTLKSWMGATHFLTRTLPKVRTEMSLQVLAYNLKRVMQILGVQPLIAAMRA
jgi:transposase